MFSSISNFSLPFGIRLSRGDASSSIPLESVEIHDIEIRNEKRARALKHLLKLNHANHSILFNHNRFHNHMPHILGSAYLLGSSPEQLNTIYEEESKSLNPWEDSPGEISRHDWRDYLSDRRYARAFIDFFEDELVLNGYDWRKVVEQYLLTGKGPLINNLVGGLGHPLIHLGYAYELSSKDIAIEALGLITTNYNYLHKYLDDPSYTKPPAHGTSSPLEILHRIYKDKRLDGAATEQGSNDTEPLVSSHEAIILEHWNSWQFSDPKKQFEDSQFAAAALVVGNPKARTEKYDFFLLHILTTSHAVRILLPFIPPKFHVSLVRQWWLLTVTVYISQLRPEISLDHINSYDLQGKDWDWVDKQGVNGKYNTDAHYVKGLRAMKEAARTWGDGEKFYLKAAARFGEEFDDWGYGEG